MEKSVLTVSNKLIHTVVIKLWYQSEADLG